MKKLFAAILACTFIFLSCGKENTVNDKINIISISFCSSSDVLLHNDGTPSSAKGYAIVKEENDRAIGEDDVLLISENKDVASVQILSVSQTLIQYEITSVSPGDTNIFAQSASGSAVSEKIKVTVEGKEDTSDTKATSQMPEPEETIDTDESKVIDSNNIEEAEPITELTEQTEAFTETEIPALATEATENTTSSSVTPTEPSEITYIINKNSKKIHLPSCSSVSRIKAENYGETNDPDGMLAQGYEWCKRCHK